MNTRSLKFQLLFWYASLLLGVFVLLGCVTYLALQSSLTASLRENQWRRARQIGQLVREEVEQHGEARLGDEIENRYAPDLNDRFVRITRKNGVVVYLSAAPKDQSFDPASLPPAQWAQQTEASRQAPLLGGRKMLMTSHLVPVDGDSYLVETGAPLDEVRADVRKLLSFLLWLLPVVGGIAVVGGYVLVKRALSPVDRIAGSAERLSLQDLTQRLPVPPSGDELERLSVALNRMLERLESSLQYSRRFVADASHELRTPLTVLRGELESLVDEPTLAPDSRERVGSALEEVQRLANIVEGLFAISRLDAGEAAAEWIKFDLAQLAAATADQLALLAEDKHLDLTCTATMGVWVEGDRARLKQVVVNLLDNAIKYTPEGGAISLQVEARGNKAILEVADTGIGIPAAALPRVFERFFRVDKARSREHGGAGLGLSIVKSICTAHQGRVEVTSTPEEGSRFRVELPLVGAPADHHHATRLTAISEPLNHEY